jgi:uncharacterized protein
MSIALPVLSMLQARVLAVLVEKQRTVPDTYPLSLNALVAGCNQKTSRDPVLSVSESEVQVAVDELKHSSLVMEGSGSRVTRFEHNMGRLLQLPSESVAMIATLMLRGPQTSGELRINCERLHRFADISSVQAYLEQLRDRPAGGLVAELPRRAGSRENRWAHLLSGPVVLLDAVPTDSVQADQGDLAAVQEKVFRLETELTEMKAKLDRVFIELGLRE